MSQIFAEPGETEEWSAGGSSLALAPMGTRVDSIGRYKMPLLPGETGTKSAAKLPRHEQWVPRGVQSMTNLASSISDTKALGDWTLQQTLIGLGLNTDVGGQLRAAVWKAREESVDFQNLRAHTAFRDELMAIAERAKDISGANAARDAGILRHDVWQEYGESGGQLFTGTEQINGEIAALRALLDAAGFEIIPDLCERTVRNAELEAAGRFDNILCYRRTGELYMADLKSKRKPFWTFLEIDGQLGGYAYSEHMLTQDGTQYIEGPWHHVNLKLGVVLHMPSDGSEPRLRKADLVTGIETMRLARRVCTVRSYGRSAGRLADSWWPVP